MKITDKFDHRPWPLPTGPWIQEQTWNNVMFIHWPVPKVQLQSLLPKGLELQTYDGTAWLSIVALRLTGVHLRNLPEVPFASEFKQLNLRTYVNWDNKPGIYLLNADASNALVVTAARQFFHLPYEFAEIDHSHDAGLNIIRSKRFNAKGASAVFTASYGPISPVYTPEKNTLDYWLTERYCLYSTDPSGEVYQNEIHHFPWPLQRAEALIGQNTLTLPNGMDMPKMSLMLCHYAHRQDVVLWGLEKVSKPQMVIL